MTHTDALTTVLRDVIAGCRATASPGQFEMQDAAAALAAAKKARATKDLAGVAWLARIFTPRNATLGWSFGGPDLLLQTALRAPLATGLPQAAEGLARDWPRAVLLPRLRLEAELDKTAYREQRAPHEYTSSLTIAADGAHAVAAGGSFATVWRLADGALAATHKFGRATLHHARRLADGTVLAIGHEAPRAVAVYRHANGKHARVAMLGDVSAASLSVDGRFAAGVADRTFEPGVPNDGSLADADRHEFRVWDLASGAVVARLRTPLDPSATFMPSHAFHPDGRVLVAWDAHVVALAPDAAASAPFREAARWPAQRVPRALALSPSGTRLLVDCNHWDAGTEVRAHLLLDARTGERLGEGAAFGAFLDEDTVVEARGHTLRVVALRTGDEVARAHFFHYVVATAGPHGEVVTAARPGSDPGPVEVFELRRPAGAADPRPPAAAP